MMHPRYETLSAQFDFIANQYPERCAIKDGQQTITYQALASRANQLAHFILKYYEDHGLKDSKRPVALFFPSSIDFVTAKLAVVKAGLPYLPLDMKYPTERIEAILNLAEVPLVFSRSGLSEAFPEGDWDVFSLDDPSLSNGSSIAPDINIDGNALAYIIFTSGSTGTPKGASIRHRNVLNVVYWTHDVFTMQPGEVGSQLTRVVFDASVWEYWANLLIGNTIVIIPEHLMLQQDELRKVFIQEQVAYTFLPTPLGEIFISQPLAEASMLKWAWVGGDRLLQRPHPQFQPQVANIYGPTETTIVCNYDVVSPVLTDTPPPIGIPVRNCLIYVLDENLKPVPDGEKGEICIAGAGVGAGYYNAPELTAKAFVPNPFSNDPNDILYRSGDLGRINAEGKFECLGRIDFQVKIRGYRIELGEIEAILNTHPKVKDVILLAEGDSNDKELIAFYTGQSPIPETELMEVAISKLPDYMIPKKLIYISEFPLTANGKIDRKALKRMLPTREEATDLPETDFEESIAGIWSQVLKAKNIRLSDRFYDLGGHSIKAVQLVGILHTRLNLDIPITYLLDNPTLAEFCNLVIDITPAKSTTIPHIENQKYYPLADGQQGMWYYWHLKPERTDYIVCLRFDIKGKVQPDTFKQALQILQDRHSIFRAMFTMQEGKPMMSFRDQQELVFEYYSFQQKDALCEPLQPVDYCEEHHQIYPYPFITDELTTVEQRMRHTPFDLANDPLYRCCLLDFEGADPILLMTIHHIITDGWSIGLWQKELRTVYHALSEGISPKLSSININFGDYTLFREKADFSLIFPEQLKYWKQKLQATPPPVDFPRVLSNQETEPKGNRVWWRLSKDTTKQLRELSKRSGNSLFATMLGLFKLQLAVYNQQWDVTLMSINAGRKIDQTRNLQGIFTNLFFVRTAYDPKKSLQELLKLENTACKEAMQNLDYPFERLLYDLFPKHDKHSEAISGIIFIMQNFPFEQSEERELIVNMRDIGSHDPKFNLLFTIEEDVDTLLCWFEYRTNLYAASTMMRVAKEYTKLCEAYCANPDASINSQMFLLPDDFAFLSGANRVVTNFPLQKSYPELWQENLKKYANRLALVASDGEFTYSELDDRANSIASYLYNRKNNGIIGVSLSRSSWLAASLIAIWKLKAAYLPLDAKYPASRLTYMLQDSKTTIVLGDESSRAAFKEISCDFIDIDSCAADIISTKAIEIQGFAKPNDPAYIIYTSGSTGTPKGVSISQRNLVNHNHAVMDEFQLSRYDRVLQFGSISFDLSVEEIFPTWLAGATLVFRNEAVVQAMDTFWDFVSENQISVIDIPTAWWHACIAELSNRELPASLRLCIIGGEKASSGFLAEWQRITQNKVRLLNTYGPTECTIIATVYEPPLAAIEFPIGRPIANCSCYALDEARQLMPYGAVGELYIAGEVVGLGYLGRTDLNSERFVSDPFGEGKMYKSGDLVRYDEGQNLHYVGRADNQVKLLGHRIELDEIASILRKHPHISDAVIILNTEDESRPYLVAYLIPLSSSLDVSQLRSYLLKSLPDFMVPAQFFLLERFPLTVNGKLDLAALPKAERHSEVSKEACELVDFYTPEQEVLCNAIQDVLKLEKVCINHNFFELGGNSILSMQLIQKLRYAGLQIGVDQLFQSKDIEELAASLTMQLPSDNTFGEACWMELKKGNPTKPPLIFIHSLPGDVLGYVNLVPKLASDQPIYGIQALGLIDPEKTHHSIEEMAGYYLNIIQHQNLPQGYMLAGWCFGGRVAIEMALMARQRSKTMPLVFLFEAYAYNPAPEKKLDYNIHRAMQTLQNWRRLPHLFKVKVMNRKAYKPAFAQGEVFQDQGIFKNRSIVRMANVAAIYSCRMKPYPGQIILFKAKHQHPDMLFDKSLGWSVFAKKLTIHVIDATHENILKDPQVNQIAELMNGILAR